MSLNLNLLDQFSTSDDVSAWTPSSVALYAVSVGAGSGDAADELRFTTENSHKVTQQVLPTFPTVVGLESANLDLTQFGDFSLAQVLHAGQRLVLHRALPTSGAVRTTTGVTAFYDTGRHAIIETASRFADAETNEILAESIGSMLVLGEGGFNGTPAPVDGWEQPERPADHIVTEQTALNQALLYRLNGDRNPLHSDPSFAKRAGFERPILHGLCTYGFSVRAVIRHLGDRDVGDIASISARFTSPVYPGDVLETSIWDVDGNALFQTRVGDTVVIDRGHLELR